MSPNNPIQFAIMREDPQIELDALEKRPCEQALLVASGGCTALTIAALKPAMKLTLIDSNSAQLAHVDKKVAVLSDSSSNRLKLFGIGVDDPTSLSNNGNFESLFRSMRAFLDDLVMPANERVKALRDGKLQAITESKYWPVAFQMFFSDALLGTMFGPEAVQSALPGSYPAYFQRVVERGFTQPKNRWLHQVLFGYWMRDALPEYLERHCTAKFELVHAALEAAPTFDRFGLISLSNLFDWMAQPTIDAVTARLRNECKSGTTVIIRQLNNSRPVNLALEPEFTVVERLTTDRSLFYESIMVLVRV
jgi:S-adenosylmethionine-diacylglycerol 3-amino-3-carboxypropyl transferase